MTRFKGELVGPGDRGYDDLRRVRNAMIDRRPALIARCTDAGDVVAALGLARDRGLPVSAEAAVTASPAVRSVPLPPS